MLALLLKRLRSARQIRHCVVATSTDEIDDAIETLASQLGFECHRGSREDVVARIAGAVDGYRGAIVRITGDCPLIDPEIVDEVVALFHDTPDCAYASNVEPRTYPDGLDVEVVSPEALAATDAEATDAYDREHVTAFVRARPQRFPAAALVNDEDLGELRWTVDTAEDLEFVRRLIRRLGSRRYTARMLEILEAIRATPSLAEFGGRRG